MDLNRPHEVLRNDNIVHARLAQRLVERVLLEKSCIKCGAEIADPQLQGDERCARCGD